MVLRVTILISDEDLLQCLVYVRHIHLNIIFTFI